MNPVEAFAVNFEFFLMDPQYKCHRPFHSRFYQKVFNYEPYAQIVCDPVKTVILSNTKTFGKDVVKSLPVDRLFSVEYLQASAGESMMSGFGHAMLRFVFCADDKPMNDECRKNPSHIYVLGFMGLIDSFKAEVTDGLTGKYFIHPNFMRMTDVMEQYDWNELRDLKATRLNLNDKEARDVLAAALFYHWTYKGKYYFLSRNCAVEVLNLLKFALPYRVELQTIQINSPNSLGEALVQNNLVYQPNDRAVGSSFYPSKINVYQKALQSISNLIGQPIKDPEQFVKINSQELHGTTLQILSRRDLAEQTNLYLLLLYRYNKKIGDLYSKAFGRLIKDEKAMEQKPLADLAAEQKFSAGVQGVFGVPALLLNDSAYGQPTDAAAKEVADSPYWQELKNKLEKPKKDGEKSLNTSIVELDTTMRDELKMLNEDIHILSDVIRSK